MVGLLWVTQITPGEASPERGSGPGHPSEPRLSSRPRFGAVFDSGTQRRALLSSRGNTRVEEACEMYTRAANMFKIAKNWSGEYSPRCSSQPACGPSCPWQREPEAPWCNASPRSLRPGESPLGVSVLAAKGTQGKRFGLG